MPIPPDFSRECLYASDCWFIHDVLELDAAAGRVLALVDTTRLGPLVDAQQPHTGHVKHVPGAVMVQITGTLGNLHAVYILGLRPSEGWVGFGTNVRSARFPGLGRIGPPMHVQSVATRVRIFHGRRFIEYAFRFEQEGRVIYESTQAAVWTRGEDVEAAETGGATGSGGSTVDA